MFSIIVSYCGTYMEYSMLIVTIQVTSVTSKVFRGECVKLLSIVANSITFPFCRLFEKLWSVKFQHV